MSLHAPACTHFMGCSWALHTLFWSSLDLHCQLVAASCPTLLFSIMLLVSAVCAVQEANMKIERQVAEMRRSAVDVGKLEGSLSAVQNQLQETQGNLSSVKADLQQATNALTSEQAAHVGSNLLKLMHPPLVLDARCKPCDTHSIQRQQSARACSVRGDQQQQLTCGHLTVYSDLQAQQMPSVACRWS